jgi:2-oxoglutarate dehydrogenase E1 component
VDLESLLTGENAIFVDATYSRWRRDPSSVPAEWAAIFRGAEATSPLEDGTGTAAAWGQPRVEPRSIFHPAGPAAIARPDDPRLIATAQRQARVAQLINAYRVRGHTEARINPLIPGSPEPHPELTLAYYGLGADDLDVPVSGRPLHGVPEVTTLRHILPRLRKAYCGSYGVEFMNIGDPEKKAWVQERVELLQDREALDHAAELRVLRYLSDAENFERLLHTRFPGTKRFSLEGAETLVPLLHLLVEELGARGVEQIVLGMAHRGRLNILANLLRKPISRMVAEFEGTAPESFKGSGDVKYHLGFTHEAVTARGDRVLLSLAFNPSHLEAVDPVVEGRVRATQERRGPGGAKAVAPLLIHGDAAFAGQGLVAEVLNLSELKGYRTGGTIHVIVNNQIGFTTSPADARSTPYCTDVARMLAVPIFHVNGEDPEAVAAVVQIAAEWRQTFSQDVIIDLYCFRKHGHNEGDEPSFTQPLLYDAIRNHPSPRVVYARRMVDERGRLTSDDVDRIGGESAEQLEQALQSPPDEGGAGHNNPDSPLTSLWAPYRGGSIHDPVDTTFPRDRLVELMVQSNTLPADFRPHQKIERLLRQRLAMAHGEQPVDWAVAELAAYASLVDQGYRVRLSGQDSGRGTFSHRHAVLTDIQTGRDYLPLQHLTPPKGHFQAIDSLLSEAAVLGFEFGYSLECPDGLVIWEAQFGDFANGAQVIIDNFIMACEQKWNRCSGLTLLLPHGYEGQGPEHSSARLERWLQLCAEDNVVVANCTTPASFYHLMRRQVLQKLRKPLVVMSPKSLLRHPAVVSSLEELTDGTFRRVLPETDPLVDMSRVQRVVFCSGKVYYDLLAEREASGLHEVALVRLEQLHPFPAGEVRAVLAGCLPGVEVVWCQEEARNMGAWPMMDEWMGEVLGGRPPRYIGRPRAASPATGSHAKHVASQRALVLEALQLPAPL